MASPALENDLRAAIRTIPDYPKPGILFRDITTLLQDARGFRKTVDELVQAHAGVRIDKVAGIEARGFILGGAVAHQLSVGFVPVRKKAWEASLGGREAAGRQMEHWLSRLRKDQ